MRARYDEPGTYTATVTVTDPGGLTDTAQVEVVVGGGRLTRPNSSPATDAKSRSTDELGGVSAS